MEAHEVQACLDTALDLKAKGTEAFKRGDIREALKFYTKVFLYTNGLDASGFSGLLGDDPSVERQPDLDEKQTTAIRTLRVATELNCSVCYLKLGDAQRALSFAERALVLEPDNAKAVYRRGQAYLALNQLGNARSDLERARQAFPSDPGVRNDLQSLKEKEAVRVQKEREVFANMFQRLATSDKPL